MEGERERQVWEERGGNKEAKKKERKEKLEKKEEKRYVLLDG